MRGFGFGLLLFALGISPALHKIHAVSSTTSPSTEEKAVVEHYVPKKEMGASGIGLVCG